MASVILSPDSSVSGLIQENARLRNLVTGGRDGLLSPPPSPPLEPTKGTPIMNVTFSPIPHSASPRFPVAVNFKPIPNNTLNPLATANAVNSALAAVPLDPANPLAAIIELMKSQMLAQAQAQEELIAQLGDIRSSNATLQAAASEVTDEVLILKNKSRILEEEIEKERKGREAAEEAKQTEAEKVSTLRQKMEESKRAIMRLQEEAAAKRNSDSRRSSIITLATPTSSVLGSASAVLGARTRVGGLGRRTSLASGLESVQLPPVPALPAKHARRASMAELGSSTDNRREFIKEANRRASLAVGRRSSMQTANFDEELTASPASIGLGLEFVDASETPLAPSQSARDLAKRRRSSARTGPPTTRRGSILSTVVMSDEDSGDSSGSGSATAKESTVEGIKPARKTVRMSQDFGDSRQYAVPPRAGSFAGFRSMPASYADHAASEQAEIAILKAQLAAANAKITETQDARSASEACLRALKDFMAAPGNSGAISLPPLPTDATDDTLEDARLSCESVARRPSMWGLPAFLSKAVDSIKTEEKIPAVPTIHKGKDPSPVLAAFNGWSARRRSIAPATKDAPSPLPGLPSANAPMGAFDSFGGFSFQSFTRNPALLSTPPSPGGGWSPGGTTRDIPSPVASPLAMPNNRTIACPPFDSVADGLLKRPSSVRPRLPTIESVAIVPTLSS